MITYVFFVPLGQKGLFHWVNLQQYDEFQELSVLTKNYEAINKPGPSQVSSCWGFTFDFLSFVNVLGMSVESVSFMTLISCLSCRELAWIARSLFHQDNQILKSSRSMTLR